MFCFLSVPRGLRNSFFKSLKEQGRQSLKSIDISGNCASEAAAWTSHALLFWMMLFCITDAETSWQVTLICALHMDSKTTLHLRTSMFFKIQAFKVPSAATVCMDVPKRLCLEDLFVARATDGTKTGPSFQPFFQLPLCKGNELSCRLWSQELSGMHKGCTQCCFACLCSNNSKSIESYSQISLEASASSIYFTNIP